MDRQELRTFKETLEGEHLKTAAELALHGLSGHIFGEKVFDFVRGGERVEDFRLNVRLDDLFFENPVMVGAGWDKKGWAVDGLYALGFSGTEVGSVLVHPQKGNPRPRLFTDSKSHSVGLNRLGFNSIGMEGVAANLDKQYRAGVVGISLGKNKLTPDEQAPWAHAAVARRLFEYADYFVINVASPNTPGLRNLLDKAPLTAIITEVQKAIAGEVLVRDAKMPPLYVKTTVDLAEEDLDDVIDVCLERNVAGIIDSNTTIDERTKARYGWEGQMGGVSGNDADFRARANQRMKHITRRTAGTGLHRIGVGAINDGESAAERMMAGAELVQVVTGIRQHKGHTAQIINRGLLRKLDEMKLDTVNDLVGLAA